MKKYNITRYLYDSRYDFGFFIFHKNLKFPDKFCGAREFFGGGGLIYYNCPDHKINYIKSKILFL